MEHSRTPESEIFLSSIVKAKSIGVDDRSRILVGSDNLNKFKLLNFKYNAQLFGVRRYF